MDIDNVSVELNNNPTKHAVKRRKQRKKTAQHNLFLTLLFVALWGALVYGGYWYLDMRLSQMQQQISQSLADIQETNNQQIQELDDKLLSVQKEMEIISQALEETGKEVSTSGSLNREELNKRMIELDKRLQELTKSLEILKESKGEIR